MITARDWAEAEWLEANHLNEGDKKIILRIQDYAEKAYRMPRHKEFLLIRQQESIAGLARRLKVSESVANALSCFVIIP